MARKYTVAAPREKHCEKHVDSHVALRRKNGAHLVGVDGQRLFRYSGVGTATDLELVVPAGFGVFDDSMVEYLVGALPRDTSLLVLL